MTQEERQLLLVDFCARLPYRVKVAFKEDGELITDTITMIGWPSNEFMLYEASEFFTIEDIKPYLRPMSSMIEEEREEYNKLVGQVLLPDYAAKLIDWLNAHHFDYRGLIEKGLALEAPKGMYDIK